MVATQPHEYAKRHWIVCARESYPNKTVLQQSPLSDSTLFQKHTHVPSDLAIPLLGIFYKEIIKDVRTDV